MFIGLSQKLSYPFFGGKFGLSTIKKKL